MKLSIFDKFAANFERRLELHDKRVITEDCLRHDLCSAILEGGFKTEDLVLECPHDHKELSRREIDLVIFRESGEEYAIEMKYFKRIPSKKQDTTGYVAKLIIDFLKLHYSKKVFGCRYLVFATDDLIHNYLEKERNGFASLHASKVGEELYLCPGDKDSRHYKNLVSKVISNKLSPFDMSLKIKKVFYKDLSYEHQIYVFEVF